MADAIKSLLHEFKLNNKVIALTTDNESAMVVCGRLLAHELEADFNNIGFSHYRCVAHVLNLAAKQGLKMIDSSIKKVRQLMGKIKVSTHLCNELRAICDLKKIKHLKTELDIETRWNSTYYMIKKFKKMEPALHLLAADNSSVTLLYPDSNDKEKLLVSINIIMNFFEFLHLSKLKLIYH